MLREAVAALPSAGRSELSRPARAGPVELPMPEQIESAQQLQTLMAMVSGVQLELTQSLQDIAERGLIALPVAEGVGVALLEDGRLGCLASTSSFVRDIDDAQYGTMQGPCVTAAAENRTVVAGSMIEQERWPDLRPQIASMGVHSALSIPLTVADVVIGTLNVYARRHNAFDDDAAARGEQYAGPAAAALHQASLLRRARLVTERIGAAMERRTIVNRTVGLLMAQDGVESAEALAMLEATAETRSEDLGSVARTVWNERIEFASLPPSEDAAWALRH